jgi:hypothetical protein
MTKEARSANDIKATSQSLGIRSFIIPSSFVIRVSSLFLQEFGAHGLLE